LIALLLGLLTAAVALLADQLLILPADQADQARALQTMARLQAGIERDLNALSTAAAGLAGWDETYQFISAPETEYLRRNLNPETMSTLQTHFILFYNQQGELIHAQGYDYRAGVELTVPPTLLERLTPDNRLLSQPDRFTRGLMLLPEGPLLIAGRGILPSDRQGPIRGTVVCARWLGDQLQQLSTSENLALTLYRADQPPDPLPPRLESLWVGNRQLEAALEITPSSELISWQQLRDLEGKPAAIIRLTQPRLLFQQARMSRLQLAGGFALVGGLAGMLLYIFLDHRFRLEEKRISLEHGES